MIVVCSAGHEYKYGWGTNTNAATALLLIVVLIVCVDCLCSAGARIRIRPRPYSLVVVSMATGRIRIRWPQHEYEYGRAGIVDCCVYDRGRGTNMTTTSLLRSDVFLWWWNDQCWGVMINGGEYIGDDWSGFCLICVIYGEGEGACWGVGSNIGE